MGTAAATSVRNLFLFGVLAYLPISGAVCGEHEECSGLGPAERAMIRSKLFSKGDFTKERCDEVLVGRVLHYQPTEKCEDAKNLYKRIAATCFAEALDILAPARLCETPRSVKFHNYVMLNIVYLATSFLYSEWIHFSKTSPFASPAAKY
jgi:hypothetical protein